ncbi:MAG: heavy metal-associated domain-containing protein [Planctomycetota bacterium]
MRGTRAVAVDWMIGDVCPMLDLAPTEKPPMPHPNTPNTSHETSLHVTGMTCNHCVHHIQKALAALPGVQSAEVDLARHRARVLHDPSRAPVEALIAAIVDEGYEASPV